VDQAQVTGPWRAAPADEALRRSATDPDFADDGWEPIHVPGHWRSTPAFSGLDGPLLYRARFSDADLPPAEGPDARTWLVLDGVFYTSDVWLDGAYVGDTEGYFFPHAFEITDAVAERAEHVLALEVGCAPQTDKRHKRNLTGVFQHWDLIDQTWNPGGIWRPVRLERSGPVRIRHLRVLCSDARDDNATVFVRAVVDTAEARQVVMRTTVRDDSGRDIVELESEKHLAAGENRLEWTIGIPNPRLWWPWSLGEQPRYNVDVDVATELGSSDARSRSLGLRRVEMRNWIFSVNGERLFLKGANQGPIRMALGEAEPVEFERDVRLAKEANLDFLRVHAHVSRPDLYEAADAQGLLIWQDLPLQWGYARGVRAQARRQAREAVDLLAHHPSVVLWCGHNEPLAIDMDPADLNDPGGRLRTAARMFAGQLLPTWNKSVLDHSIASVLEKADGSRPVIAHSGILPHPPQLDGTDSHWYFGWYHGEQRDFPALLRRWPRVARFVSEFGAQAVPDDAAFLEPERWPNLDWDRAARVHSLQKPMFDRYVPPADHATFDEWRDATQRYQAKLIRDHVTALRLLKYRPTGGFAQFCFADGQPAVSWSVLDHDRTPKLGFAALRDACAPVVVTATPLPAALRAGDALFVRIWAISDRRISFPDMVASLHLYWRSHGPASANSADSSEPERSLDRSWQGDLPADAATHLATIETTVADADRLDLVVRLHDADGALVAEHHDATLVER
jgi:beta-mannosidase